MRHASSAKARDQPATGLVDRASGRCNESGRAGEEGGRGGRAGQDNDGGKRSVDSKVVEALNNPPDVEKVKGGTSV